MAASVGYVKKVTLTLLSALVVSMVTFNSDVKADECGTRFTDLTSSSVLAQAVLKGTVQAFNPMSQQTRMHTANISVDAIYKGDNVVSGAKLGDVIVVTQFGEEDREGCVVPAAVISPDVEHIFFLRQTALRGELQMSAFPVQSDSDVVRRVRRSLCPTCIRPPTIRRLMCKNCAKAPVIKRMKPKKVKMGRRARLRCTARAKPKPEFSWTKNGIPVVSGSGGIIVRSSAFSSSLHFRRTMDAHAGEYICKAQNQIGETEKGVMLELTQRINSASRRTPAVGVNVPLPSSRNETSTRGFSVNRPALPSNDVLHTISETSQTGPLERGGTSQVPSTPPNTFIAYRSSSIPVTSSPSTTSTTATTPSTAFRRVFTRKPSKVIQSRLNNRRLKTVFCKDKTYCLNGGRCKRVLKLDVQFCQCRPGFAGKRCEIII